MRKTTVLIGLMLLFTLISISAEAGDPEQSPATTLDKEQKKTDKAREVACDCCNQCLAATKPVKSKEEGPPATNGCQDCCEKCGKSELTPPEKIPPEIMEKK